MAHQQDRVRRLPDQGGELHASSGTLIVLRHAASFQKSCDIPKYVCGRCIRQGGSAMLGTW